MKRADKNTGYLMVRAYTGSEWDICDYAIIKIDKAWIQTMQQRMAAVEPFKKDNLFCGLSYWDAPENFFKDNEDDTITADGIIGEEDWCFVETTKEELESLPQPESRLDTHRLMIDRYGNFCYKAYGKHSGEEYYSTDVSFEKLLEAINR